MNVPNSSNSLPYALYPMPIYQEGWVTEKKKDKCEMCRPDPDCFSFFTPHASRFTHMNQTDQTDQYHEEKGRNKLFSRFSLVLLISFSQIDRPNRPKF